MSFVWMRRIDSWIGRPILGVLGWFSTPPRSLYGETESKKIPSRVICTKFTGVGNVVLSLPLFKALKDSGAHVAFWSFEGQAEIIRLSGLADEIYVVRPTLKGFLPSLIKSYWQAKRFKAEAFLDLEPAACFSAILSRLSGARFRVGFLSQKPYREAMYTHLVSPSRERHRIETNLWLGKRLGLSMAGETMLPALPSLDRIKNVLPQAGFRRRVMININAGDLSWHRMWPEDYWIELCNRLLGDFNVDLIFPGGELERDRIQALIARLRDPTRVFNLAGTVSLVELLRILHDCSLVVSVDSGIVHLTAWAGTPQVTLFGPDSPLPLGPRSSLATNLWAGLPCSPCMSVSGGVASHCRESRCMSEVTPDMAYRACLSLMSRAQGGVSKNPRVA